MEIRLENLYVDIGAKTVNVYKHDRGYKTKFRLDDVQLRE